MPFPTTSLLSNFTGADEDPLSEGGNWNGPVRNGHAELKRVSNQAAGSNLVDPGACESYWAATTFGPDVESWATCLVVSSGIQVWGRLHNPDNPSTMEAYSAVYDPGVGFRCFRVTAGGTFTQIGSTDATTMSDGDKIGLEIIGTTIKCYHGIGANWFQRVSTTDSTVTGTGFIALCFQDDDTVRADDFGGGTVVTASATPTWTTKRSQVERARA